MRKFCLVLFGVFLCIDGVNAAVRTQNTNLSRQATTKIRTENTKNRSVSARETKSRTAANKIVTGRSTTKKTTLRKQTAPSIVSRATTTQTFGTSYNLCRDAYFTCMDQFCALQDETYRRCVCSSKLQSIKKQEQQLSQTADSLKNFEALNIDTITKTSNEVHAMLNASDGELGITKDTSDSAHTLKNISTVLNDSKSKSLSTHGTLDIAGNIKSIWNTTNLIGGTDIANLTGESLYNAVHTQCAEMVAPNCTTSDLKMISSAYGMYIENDCAVLEANIKNKTINANTAIRETRHKMQDTRLENYNTHNAVNINDCIANVRQDITSEYACGADYIHCLDFSGKYINSTTGAPIYSPDFYQIENQISLSDDVLTNNKNATFVNMLNKKRSFATQSLDLCRDNAEDVWQEFLKQALVEIYQAQQSRVKQVQTECLAVVNECYLHQSETLKNFLDNDAKINTSQTLVLSEEMCAEKLNTCSNLYGGGTSGLEALVATMTGITDNTIAQSCPELLNTFVQKLCAVSVNDSAHSAPYGCRTYAPGEARYARETQCNSTLVNPFAKTNILSTSNNASDAFSDYTKMCSVDTHKIYTKCKYGYYLYSKDSCNTNTYCYVGGNNPATECRPCPTTAICQGDTSGPSDINSTLYDTCGEYYIGSLYQQLVRYAMQNCTRTPDTDQILPESLLIYIDNVMDATRAQLVSELAKECTNQSGIWIDIPWIDKNGDGLHDSTGDSLLHRFYLTTGTNTLWGYCKE